MDKINENKICLYERQATFSGYHTKPNMQIPLRRSRLSGTVRATNPDKREPLTFET